MLNRTIRLFSISWSRTLQYRGDLALWFFSVSATPLVSFAIWYSISQGNSQLISAKEILTYYVLIIFIRITTSSWHGYFLIQQILNGTVVNYLIRPRAIYGEFITNNITTKIMQLLIPLPIIFFVLASFPEWFSPTIYNPFNIFMFFVSLLIAFMISFTFDISMGLLAFWLEDAQELMAYRFILTQIASGILIPFALMPNWLFSLLSALPFRYIISAPAEILLAQTQGIASIQLVGIQLLWLIGFVIILRTLYIRGLKRYAIPGQ